MKLKHLIRELVIAEVTKDSQLSIRAVRKAVEGNDTLKEKLPDKQERKQQIEGEVRRLIEKGKLEDIDGVLLARDAVSEATETPAANTTKKRALSTDGEQEGSGDQPKKKKESDWVVADQEVEASRIMPESNKVPISYPPPVKPTGNNTILLFYAYCSPSMTRAEQDEAIAFCYSVLTKNKVSGRLRVGKEGFNSTLTGPHDGVRAFTKALREKFPQTFGQTDFKYVDNQPDSQLLKGLKVWPVTEIVTYGFNPDEAPLDMRGVHLKPQEFHEALENPNSVVIDVRNFNETLIGKFAPPLPPGVTDMSEKVLDPCMRRSTEFPQWLEDNRHKLEGKQVLMYCTAGVRCERASAYMRYHGIQNVYQLEGGIHRYLDAYPEDGGHWIGKNYVFDKRFSHGAEVSEVISYCAACDKPWERYQAQMKCFKCAMEVLVCRDCQRQQPPVPKHTLFCPLCKPNKK